MKIQEYVDYQIRSSLEGAVDPGEIVQVTLRIPVIDRHKADVICAFIGVTRNALFTAILQDGLDVAFERIKQNPVASSMTVNGKTPDEAYEALLSGQPFVNMTASQTEDYIEQLNTQAQAGVRTAA
jgi:hypothetical protein